VLATGFRTVEFMHPIKVTGSKGRAMAEVWKNGAHALYGTTVEDMPNFAMLYGPNTNLGHNSIILMIEAQSRYTNGLISAVLDARERGQSLALKPKKERVDMYNNEIQAALVKSSFADPRCNSWYKNRDGKITNNWSGTVVDYQKMLSTLNWDDFDAEGSGADIVRDKGKTNVGRVVEETQITNMSLILGALGTVAIVGGLLARRDTRRLSRFRAW